MCDTNHHLVQGLAVLALLLLLLLEFKVAYALPVVLGGFWRTSPHGTPMSQNTSFTTSSSVAEVLEGRNRMAFDARQYLIPELWLAYAA